MTALLLRALLELVRYDALARCFGFPAIRRRMRAARASRRAGADTVEKTVRAMACVTSFYWKPLLCLQRSVVTARLLRAQGVPAEVVIGYRPAPFFSHAWVEVGGVAVNDSAGYQTKLLPLDRF